jgi:hypothetical protein
MKAFVYKYGALVVGGREEFGEQRSHGISAENKIHNFGVKAPHVRTP